MPDTKKGIDTGGQRVVNVIKETNRVKRTGRVRGLVALDLENRDLWGKASHLFLWVPETKNGFTFFIFKNICLFIFKRTSILCSMVAAQMYIPANSVADSPGSTPSPAFVICRLFDDGHSDQCEEVPHCSFLKSLFN